MSMNLQRAAWAENAMDTFTRETFGRRLFVVMCSEDREDAAADMISDLLHLCRISGIDVDTVMERGLANFKYELEHPEEE